MRQRATTLGGFGPLPMIAALAAGLAACSDIRSEPNVEAEGVLQSPTHEADPLRRAEEQRGGGGGSY